jgi:hypothetical protein
MAGATASHAEPDAAFGPELQALSARLLAERRVNEVAAALRVPLDEVASQFSYARARGLRALCATVCHAATPREPREPCRSADAPGFTA